MSIIMKDLDSFYYGLYIAVDRSMDLGRGFTSWNQC